MHVAGQSRIMQLAVVIVIATSELLHAVFIYLFIFNRKLQYVAI